MADYCIFRRFWCRLRHRASPFLDRMRHRAFVPISPVHYHVSSSACFEQNSSHFAAAIGQNSSHFAAGDRFASEITRVDFQAAPQHRVGPTLCEVY